jgi:hypothetical protein
MNALYHESLAGVLAMKKDFVGAEVAARRAIALAPERAPAYATLTQAAASKGRVAEVLRVHTDALRRHPALAANPANGFLYNAACCAARCAAGQGTDVPPDADRPGLRRQALGWLTADLAAWRKSLAADPVGNRARVHATMRHWLQDADLASVREPAGLDGLPTDERVGWVGLWTAVRDLRDATAPPEQAPPPRPAR